MVHQVVGHIGQMEPQPVGGLEWMAWTWGTFLLVAGVFVALLGLTVLAVLRPSTPRQGFLPMPTARGDRIYVGLLGSGLILIVLIALTDLPIMAGLGLGAVWMFVVVRWG
jgi:predicted small integral membrane protein